MALAKALGEDRMDQAAQEDQEEGIGVARAVKDHGEQAIGDPGVSGRRTRNGGLMAHGQTGGEAQLVPVRIGLDGPLGPGARMHHGPLGRDARLVLPLAAHTPLVSPEVYQLALRMAYRLPRPRILVQPVVLPLRSLQVRRCQ